MLGVFLLLSLLSVAFGGKLSEAENLERSQTCGRVFQHKVLGGTPATLGEAPWMGMLHYKAKGYSHSIFTSATVISSRHIVSMPQVLLYLDPNAKKFKWVQDDSLVDMSTCKNGVIQVPDKYATGLRAQACGNHERCHDSSTILHAKRAMYMGNCGEHDQLFGMVVMEMENDFAMDTGIVPVCVTDQSVVSDDDKVTLYGLGGTKSSDAGNSVKARVNKAETLVKACQNVFFPESSICINSVICGGDEGAPFVKKVNDQMTAVALSYSGTCDQPELRQHPSFAAFALKICEFSGVCTQTSSGESKPAKRISGKLNDEENRQRAGKCGSRVQTKIFGGRHIPAYDAPWTVLVHADKNGQSRWTGGFIVSKRHAIASSLALFKDSSDGKTSFTWRHDDKAADLSTCKNGMMKIPDHITAQLSVTMCSMSGSYDSCYYGPKIMARSATYIGNCDVSTQSLGMILMELEVDVHEGYVSYVCLAESVITAPGDELNVYSVGSLDNNPTSVAKVSTGTTKVAVCNFGNSNVNSLSVCVKDLTGCHSDNGGVYTKIVNGKHTAVAVDYKGYCKKDENISFHPSIAAFFSQICEVSGICTPKEVPMPTSMPTSHKRIVCIVAIFTVFIVVVGGILFVTYRRFTIKDSFSEIEYERTSAGGGDKESGLRGRKTNKSKQPVPAKTPTPGSSPANRKALTDSTSRPSTSTTSSTPTPSTLSAGSYLSALRCERMYQLEDSRKALKRALEAEALCRSKYMTASAEMAEKTGRLKHAGERLSQAEGELNELQATLTSLAFAGNQLAGLDDQRSVGLRAINKHESRSTKLNISKKEEEISELRKQFEQISFDSACDSVTWQGLSHKWIQCSQEVESAQLFVSECQNIYDQALQKEREEKMTETPVLEHTSDVDRQFKKEKMDGDKEEKKKDKEEKKKDTEEKKKDKEDKERKKDKKRK